MNRTYCTVTNTTGIIRCNISGSHKSQTTMAMIEAESSTLEIGDLIEINIGYSDNYKKRFYGYIKSLEITEAERKISISANDVLIRAVDYFIVSSDPEAPFTRSNITAEDLVRDIMALAGLTNYSSGTTYFTFAIQNPLEVNLTSSYDYGKFIADIIGWQLYATSNGVIKFVDRTPYPVLGDASITTFDNSNIIDISYSLSDRDLRNRIVVYGSGSIVGEAKETSPYLPNNPDGSPFYKSVLVAAPGIIDTQEMAQSAAEYNLELLNRLTKSVQLTVEGDPNIEARKCATIDRADLGLTGKWYIYSADHVFSKQGYTCTVELRK